MKQTVNRTDKHRRQPMQPGRLILMTWIAPLLAGLATSCGEYDDPSTKKDAAIPVQPVGDASSPGDVAQPTGGGGPITNDANQTTGTNDADANSYQSNDSGILLDGGSSKEDASGPDTDTDSESPPIDASVDGDDCPDDPDKTAPGVCGCGVPDTDEDDDGTLECEDACPQDDSKTEPGVCGCGNEEPSDSDATMIDCVKSHLIHRYSFDGTGSTITDSVGSANGTVNGDNATLAAGSLSLGGDEGADYTNEGCGELPSSVWEGLTSVTFETWVTWRGESETGSALWQRIFDFGDQNGSDGNSYIFLTPQCDTGVLVGFSVDSASGDNFVVTSTALPRNVEKHLAVVVDGDQLLLYLYIDGVWQSTTPIQAGLTSINADHCWLGRSNFAVDSEFNGSYNEFRIWDVALSGDQLSASFDAGPDYEF